MMRFQKFYKALDEKDYEKAEKILKALESDLGDDPELVSMRVQLDLDQL